MYNETYPESIAFVVSLYIYVFERSFQKFKYLFLRSVSDGSVNDLTVFENKKRGNA